MKEWFKDWFNTEEYLSVYRHRNDEDAVKLVNLILNNVEIKLGSNVIDLASGAGRHSILFAEKGFNVTSVDLSENLLEVARKTSEKLGLKINFVNADLRNFCITSRFDLAVNLFTSFGYFNSDKQNYSLFSTAYNLLNDNAFFVLDFFNSNYIRNNLVEHSEDSKNGKWIIQERKIFQDRVIKNIKISNNGNSKSFMESVRLYTQEELISAVQTCGFNVEKTFGDYDGNNFDLDSSGRIIIISRK
jgi:cyclopropane fatty-acyl-phospholipid synthase-like methyltransferase